MKYSQRSASRLKLYLVSSLTFLLLYALNLAKVVDLNNARVTFSDLQPTSRIAYVVTVNESSTRYAQTRTVLDETGFTVRPIKPVYVGDSLIQRTYSNKLALLRAVERIATGEEPWGYVFEDDIAKHELSTARISDVVASESKAHFFQYLGICLPNQESKARKTCGRCAHAMGFSRTGADELLKFSRTERSVTPKQRGEATIPAKEAYMDVIVDIWCQANGGFMVSGPLEESSTAAVSGHVGMFVQDRKKFDSIISNSPNV